MWQVWRLEVGVLAFDAEALAAAGFAELGRRFLLWRTFPPRRAGGKPVKSPCTPWGVPIDGTDERRWIGFDEAAALAYRHARGLGVALGWGLGGLDLDRCVNNAGELTARASCILRHFPTYTELSPSGTGVKAYFIAGPSFTSTVKLDILGVELYAGRRFFALTGRPWGGSAARIVDCTAAARTLVALLRPLQGPAVPPRTATPPGGEALTRLRACDPIRERPSLHGGTVYTLRRCPFTGEEHAGGGPYAITFGDGGLYFRCDRSTHGLRAEVVRARRIGSISKRRRYA